MGGSVDGFKRAKAVLRIAYINQEIGDEKSLAKYQNNNNNVKTQRQID